MPRAPQTIACLGLLLLVLLTNRAQAQYHFEAWTTESGLPHNTIKTILQTRDGYLWLASLDGLVRYDGMRFTVFNTGNSPGLKSNRLTSLFEDQSGLLWIGTEDSGLVTYRDGLFTPFTTDQGLPNNFVRRIWADAEGNIVLMIGQRLFNWKAGKVVRYTLPTEALPIFTGGDQQSGLVWYSDQLGLRAITKAGLVTLMRPGSESSTEVTSVFQDRQGAFWIGTRRLGLSRVKDDVVTVFTTKNGLPENSVRTITEDRRGNLWLGIGDSGLVRYRDGVFTRYTTADGLSDNSVMAIYEDREDNLWVGTYAHGLNRLSRDVVRMYSEQNGLPANNVYPILEDRSGAVWLGTWPKGLARFADDKFKLYQKEDGLPGGSLTALAEDRDGALWIGFYGGLASFKDGRFTNFTGQLDPAIQYISAILPENDGAIWLGANTGLFKFRDGRISRFTTADGLAGNEIKAILRDRCGVLWAGSYTGLSRYQDGHWRAYTKHDGLTSDKVRSLYEDKEGVLWIGTYDGGISRIKDEKVSSITQKDGLYNNGVFQILEDDRGNFWLSCNLGIYRVSKQQLNDFADGKVKFVTSVPYGRRDGLTNIECNGGTQPAGIRTRDGRLWFPTQGGAAVIDPKDITLNTQPPPVMIEGCLLERETVDCRQEVRIRPEQQSLEINYTGLSFINPEQIRFKYRLTGLDDEWIDVGTRRTAYFSHLPPGAYTFTVIAANSDGVWNTVGRSVQIVVVPPFWRTWWFVVLVSLAIVATTVLMYRRRISNLKRERDVQEAFTRRLIDSQESERKRIAGELHDSLGQSLAIIKNHALFGLHGPENVVVTREGLKQISIQSAQAIDEVKEISYNLRPHLLDRLGLTKAIESMVGRVAESSGINFAAEIDNVDGIFSAEEEINLYRILQEGINNVVKHSAAASALVRLNKDERTIRLTISDDGKGFTQAAVESNTASHKHGFGLMGITERVRILGGRQVVRSAPGEGTAIIVTLTLKGRAENSGK
jgi:ligand-binding sensor domain-containing protein/signal transduction histidine kinase